VAEETFLRLKMSKKAARPQAPRYGIAEWFGKDITKMSAADRKQYASLCANQQKPDTSHQAPICPFLSTLIPGARCNKTGGVCSIRKFSDAGNGVGAPVKGDHVVTVCPSRFLQRVSEDRSLFEWISEKMLDVRKPTIIKETPFLRKITDANREPDIEADMEEESKEEGKKAGRIDWILVKPDSLSNSELEWCAVETQALYFSGGNMNSEFEAYAVQPSSVLFPAGKRRPDYRSSGPKRLAPQLDVKVPVLRTWGKKVVVVIDRYFFENMNTLADAYPKAKGEQEKRDNAEIVWFVVSYDENLNLKADTIVYTNLESSRVALNATEPLSKADFTAALKAVIANPGKGNKVFKT